MNTIKHLSNGAKYDPIKGLYIRIMPDLPHPQNREQISLDRLSVKLIRNLTDDELDYLRSEVRRLIHLPIKSCKEEPWYKKILADRVREDLRRELQHEYYWRGYAKHMEFWSWMKKFKPNQYHALNGLQFVPEKQKQKILAVRKQIHARNVKQRYNWRNELDEKSEEFKIFQNY